MEENIEIIIKFKDEEKTLSSIPETFDELKQIFENLFGQEDSNGPFSFSYKIGNFVCINAENYNEEIFNIKQMENPIIYVEKEKVSLFDTNDDLAVSIVNEENSNSLLNLSQSLRNLHVSNTVKENKQIENKKNIEQLEEELNITNEKLINEIENVKKLKALLDNLTGDENQNTKIENLNKKIEFIKKENEKKYRQIIEKNKDCIMNNIKKDNEIKDLKEKLNLINLE